EGYVLVAEAKGKVLGFAAVLPRDDGDADLESLFVEPGQQRMGVGAKLVKAASALAQGRGAERLYAIGNALTRKVLEGTGFIAAGETSTRVGPALVMRLEL